MKILLDDPETLSLIWNGERFDLETAAKLMKKLTQFAILDISGGGVDGNLNNTVVENIFATHDLIMNEMREASDPEDLKGRLDRISHSQAEERIAMALAFMDDDLDERAAGYHLGILRGAVQTAIAQGEFTREDWQAAQDHTHRIIETSYLLTDRLSQMGPDGKCRIFKDGGEQGWVNPSFLKYQVIRGKVAEWAATRFAKPDLVMYVVDKNGEQTSIGGVEEKLNAALLSATTNLEFDDAGKTAYLTDRQGQRIKTLKFNEITEDSIYKNPNIAHLQLQFLDDN